MKGCIIKTRKSLTLTFLLVILLSIALPNITSIAKPPENFSYDIEFLGWEVVDDMNVKFTYKVKSYEKPAISHWQLNSCCFYPGVILDSSEPYEKDQLEHHILKFDEEYKDNEERTVWFIIHVEDYESCGIGTIDFTVKGGRFVENDEITGPSCKPDFYIPENPLGTLGAMIPLLAALGLVIASKKNIITITVEK